MIFKFLFNTKLEKNNKLDFLEEDLQEDSLEEKEQNKSKKDDFSEMFEDKKGILSMISLFIFFIAIILIIYFWRFFRWKKS